MAEEDIKIIEEDVKKTKKKNKKPSSVKVETKRGFHIADGWLEKGTYEFTKQEADNLVKKGLGKII